MSHLRAFPFLPDREGMARRVNSTFPKREIWDYKTKEFKKIFTTQVKNHSKRNPDIGCQDMRAIVNTIVRQCI